MPSFGVGELSAINGIAGKFFIYFEFGEKEINLWLQVHFQRWCLYSILWGCRAQLSRRRSRCYTTLLVMGGRPSNFSAFYV
jgi:hypothetical protein